jgi:hypothetical protein
LTVVAVRIGRSPFIGTSSAVKVSEASFVAFEVFGRNPFTTERSRGSGAPQFTFHFRAMLGEEMLIQGSQIHVFNQTIRAGKADTMHFPSMHLKSVLGVDI